VLAKEKAQLTEDKERLNIQQLSIKRGVVEYKKVNLRYFN
jgi:hypothetical protein